MGNLTHNHNNNIMKHTNKQFAGIWLDGHHAAIISADEAQDFSISSRISGTDSQSGGSEHSMNQGKKTELDKFFRSIATQLAAFDEILIFGPGQAQEQLKHHLDDSVQFKQKKISIDSSDQLTDPQMLAKVKDFFKGRMS